MNTISQESNLSSSPTEVQELKTHVQTFSRHKIDAKSILLMDLEGQVQEPTKQTISLLGTRSSASYRKSQANKAPQDALLSDKGLTAKQLAGKRFRGEHGLAVEVPEVFRCTFGTCTKEFRSSQYFKTHLAYHQSRANFVCTVPTC